MSRLCFLNLGQSTNPTKTEPQKSGLKSERVFTTAPMAHTNVSPAQRLLRLIHQKALTNTSSNNDCKPNS